MQGSGQGQTGQPTQDWVKNASPDELIRHARSVFGRIGELDQTYRDQFVSQIKSDPAARKLLDTLATA